MKMAWVLGVAGGLIGLWAAYTAVYEGGLETPSYDVVRSDGSIEVRDYPPFLVASTELEAGSEAGQGFRVLAGYIFGGNRSQESMAMTAPVFQQYGDSQTMAFVMPQGRAISELPEPNSDSVGLSELRLGRMVVWRFAGRGRKARFESAEVKLRAWMDGHGFEAAGEALYAQYNSPTAFPPLRRNEVMIPVAQPPAE